jgi:hypothetical protein
MSTNIVQSLRDTAQIASLPAWLRAECEQAADRIEAQAAELDRLRAERDAWKHDALALLVVLKAAGLTKQDGEAPNAGGKAPAAGAVD